MVQFPSVCPRAALAFQGEMWMTWIVNDICLNSMYTAPLEIFDNNNILCKVWSLEPSDHEAMFLSIVGHEDHVPVGGPDEAGQFEVVLGAWRGRLHWRDLVRLNAAQLRG